MAKRFSQFVLIAAFCLVSASMVLAQVSSVGTIIGTVTDATGAVIAGAEVKAKDEATGATFETRSGPDGSFRIASLRPGNYIVTVSMQGFKSGEFRNVRVVVGQITEVAAKMEVGEMQSTVVVEAGAEVLETASTVIGTTITGKAITQLPLSSRDALDLAVLMPGASTTGRVRQTSFMGLPKGAINITMDGINAQDNILKSSDGFFTIIRPRVDSMEEFSISTAGQGSDQSAEGAVQIRFETKRGGNEYHGGGWWQHRNDFFNSNYWFSNRDGVNRQRQRLNQFGGKVGGPILKEKLFFFVAMDNYRNPNSQVRTRTILAPEALNGLFEYGVSAAQGAVAAPNAWTTCTTASARTGLPTCTVDLVAMSNDPNSTATTSFGPGGNTPLVFDPFVSSTLSAIDSARTAAGVGLNSILSGSPHIDRISFNNPGDATRRFPDLRLDYNVTKAHQVSFIYHYNYFTSTPDFLNGFDQTYPVAPFNTLQGSQISNRNQWTGAWRWNLAANMSNELRIGLQTAPVSFFPDLQGGLANQALYPTIANNLGTINLRPFYGVISNPILGFSLQGRNTPTAQLIETFSWTKGKHSFTFGGTWTEVRLKQFFASRRVHTAQTGLAPGDNVNLMISSTNFPGSSTTQRGNAGALFALLAGRVGLASGNPAYTGAISVDPETRQFVPGGNLSQKVKQTEFGIFATDQWRIRPSMTFNYGLRMEYQGAPEDPDNLVFRASNVFGVSGEGNLFQPGTVPGSIPTFALNGDQSWYDKQYNFAPNVGLAWTPGIDNGLYNMLFGGPGKTVFRGAYSITFTREGIGNFTSIAHSNPGISGSIFSTAGAGPTPGTACPAGPQTTAGSYTAGCLTIQGILNGDMQALTTSPAAFVDSGSFQITPFSGQSVNAFESGLGIPTVHSWSIGIQREINPSMVFEVRYVGNHGSGLWRQVNLNEVNIFENGFLQEFLNAKSNLAIAGGGNFRNQGLAGQVPLPIFEAAFGTTLVSQFGSSTFITPLNNNTPGAIASTLANTSVFLCNLVGFQTLQGSLPTSPCPASGAPPAVGPVNPLTGQPYAANFWVANPHATGGGAFLMTNASHSTHNGLQVEFRRRPTRGLQFNTNYTWSKSLTNYYADSSASFSGFHTYRNPGLDKGISPWDLRHAFKAQGIYEFPFGPGRKWSSDHGWVNQVIGGWEISTTQRWQTGRVFRLDGGRATFNSGDGGVVLTGINAQQLQSMLEIRKTPSGQVFYFPASLIATGGSANFAFMRPCGEGAPSEAGTMCNKGVFLYGPMFYRADFNIVKRFRITENWNIEYRAEFLNAFNNINFFFPGSETTSVPTTSVTSTTFGQVTNAFRDVSTTDDNGGRIIQMVLRINF